MMMVNGIPRKRGRPAGVKSDKPINRPYDDPMTRFTKRIPLTDQQRAVADKCALPWRDAGAAHDRTKPVEPDRAPRTYETIRTPYGVMVQEWRGQRCIVSGVARSAP